MPDAVAIKDNDRFMGPDGQLHVMKSIKTISHITTTAINIHQHLLNTRTTYP
jgi:hypothetical protein